MTALCLEPRASVLGPCHDHNPVQEAGPRPLPSLPDALSLDGSGGLTWAYKPSTGVMMSSPDTHVEQAEVSTVGSGIGSRVVAFNLRCMLL